VKFLVLFCRNLLMLAFVINAAQKSGPAAALLCRTFGSEQGVLSCAATQRCIEV
jgi:hypothetical protein